MEPVLNGIIPVNQHGNVEVWDGNQAYVPAGAVFLEAPRALATAQKLGLPHAAAVTGFDRRGNGVTAPRMGGVVVLREHAELVQEGAECLEVAREEAQWKKREKALVLRWERLVFAAVSRQQLREKYGH